MRQARQAVTGLFGVAVLIALGVLWMTDSPVARPPTGASLAPCEAAYANRLIDPARASVACNTAYYDLPTGSHYAALAKAMKDAADAVMWGGADAADAKVRALRR